MTEFQINDCILWNEAKDIAKDIIDELQRDNPEADADELRELADDRAHETVDGHQWVIYTHCAVMMCAHCNTDEGEAFLEDTGMPDDVTFAKLASIIAYGELRYRVMDEINDLLEEMDRAA